MFRVVVLVGVLLGVGGDGGIVSRLVARGRGIGAILSREDGFSGLIPLGLLRVDVDVEPTDSELVFYFRHALRRKAEHYSPFFILLVPARGPTGGNFGSLGRGRPRRRGVIGH